MRRVVFVRETALSAGLDFQRIGLRSVCGGDRSAASRFRHARLSHHHPDVALAGLGHDRNIDTGTDTKIMTRGDAATAAGMSKRQKETALQAANVPAAKFDAAVESSVSFGSNSRIRSPSVCVMVYRPIVWAVQLAEYGGAPLATAVISKEHYNCCSMCFTSAPGRACMCSSMGKTDMSRADEPTWMAQVICADGTLEDRYVTAATAAEAIELIEADMPPAERRWARFVA